MDFNAPEGNTYNFLSIIKYNGWVPLSGGNLNYKRLQSASSNSSLSWKWHPKWVKFIILLEILKRMENYLKQNGGFLI